MRLILIVNGEDVPVEVKRPCRLSAVRDEALRLSRNTGRPTWDWELCDVRGNRLDADQLAQEFESGTKMFLTLVVGAGGSHMNYRRKNRPGHRPQGGGRSTKDERLRSWAWRKRVYRRFARRIVKANVYAFWGLVMRKLSCKEGWIGPTRKRRAMF